MNILRQFRHKSVRSPVEASLNAAAFLPNSGHDGVETSQGASAAAAELSKELDFVIDQTESKRE
jgi:hypothetical protein